MNKKVLVGLIAVIVAVVIAVVCVIVSGDNDTDSKKDKDNKVETEENNITLDPSERDARCKTCVANQRLVVSQLVTCAMSDCVNYSGTITYTSDGEMHSDFYSDVEGIDEEKYATLFQYIPICPSCGTYKITLTPVDNGVQEGDIRVAIECIDNEDGREHKYN